MGVITAPTSRVLVTSHDTAVVPAPVKPGMLGRSGTMTVCMMAWKTAPTARTGKTRCRRSRVFFSAGLLAFFAADAERVGAETDLPATCRRRGSEIDIDTPSSTNR
ncbi:hypothetical protein RDE2_03330 [Rhodococcus sp. RDE2]|nr:hypothetical protein RDE2_03330 [Rhodococcus sp. RDE2]